MRLKMLMMLPVMVLVLTGVAFGDGPSDERHAGKEAPKIPGITKVKPGTDIKKIKSDPFTMKGAKIGHADPVSPATPSASAIGILSKFAAPPAELMNTCTMGTATR